MCRFANSQNSQIQVALDAASSGWSVSDMCSHRTSVVIRVEEYQLASQAGGVLFRSRAVVFDDGERSVAFEVVEVFLTPTTHFHRAD